VIHADRARTELLPGDVGGSHHRPDRSCDDSVTFSLRSAMSSGRENEYQEEPIHLGEGQEVGAFVSPVYTLQQQLVQDAIQYQEGSRVDSPHCYVRYIRWFHESRENLCFQSSVYWLWSRRKSRRPL
jgi:hypothetical protein